MLESRLANFRFYALNKYGTEGGANTEVTYYQASCRTGTVFATTVLGTGATYCTWKSEVLADEHTVDALLYRHFEEQHSYISPDNRLGYVTPVAKK